MFGFELKNIKYAAFASEETLCFEASVYLDGKKLFGASNDGKGGPNSYFPINGGKIQRQVWDAVRRMDEKISKVKDEHGLSYDMDLICSYLLTDWLMMKDLKKLLKKVTFEKGGKLYQLNSPASDLPKHRTHFDIKAKEEGRVYLNDLPINEAFELYKSLG